MYNGLAVSSTLLLVLLVAVLLGSTWISFDATEGFVADAGLRHGFKSKDYASETLVHPAVAWTAQPTRCFSCQHQAARVDPTLAFREGASKCFSCERAVGARSLYSQGA